MDHASSSSVGNARSIEMNFLPRFLFCKEEENQTWSETQLKEGEPKNSPYYETCQSRKWQRPRSVINDTVLLASMLQTLRTVVSRLPISDQSPMGACLINFKRLDFHRGNSVSHRSSQIRITDNFLYPPTISVRQIHFPSYANIRTNILF